MTTLASNSISTAGSLRAMQRRMPSREVAQLHSHTSRDTNGLGVPFHPLSLLILDQPSTASQTRIAPWRTIRI